MRKCCFFFVDALFAVVFLTRLAIDCVCHLQIYWFVHDTVESSVARLAGLQLFSLFILSIGIFVLATTKSPMQECLAKDATNIVRTRVPISIQLYFIYSHFARRIMIFLQSPLSGCLPAHACRLSTAGACPIRASVSAVRARIAATYSMGPIRASK